MFINLGLVVLYIISVLNYLRYRNKKEKVDDLLSSVYEKIS